MKRDVFVFQHAMIEVDLPYYTFEGKAGPTLILSGGMHGDEINGVSLVRKLLQTFQHNDIESILVGRIIVIPLLNPTGFSTMERRVTIDDKDPNRAFGQSDNKTFTNFWADALYEAFYRQADYGIDIHDSGGRAILAPHSRIHKCDDNSCERCTYEMGKLLDTKIVLSREGEEGMLATYANSQGVPVLTVEVGGGQLIHSEYHKDVTRGIYNILYKYGFLPGDVQLDNTGQERLDVREYYKTHSGGEIYLNIDVGDHVTKGQKLGTIYYHQLEKSEDIISFNDGYVFSKWSVNQIPTGVNAYSLIF